MSIPGLPAVIDPSLHIMPGVKVNLLPIPPQVSNHVRRVVVDTHLHLPGMFELTFEDGDNTVMGDLGIAIGAMVEISAQSSSDSSSECLMKGEVTSIEGDYRNTTFETIVRGYEKTHRLQRATRSRTFLDMTDADIAKKIADEAGVHDQDIDDTSTTHKHIAQVAQTDWDFLKYRAQEIGYEIGVEQGTFFFRKPSSAGGGAGGLPGGLPSLPLPSATPTLTFQDSLLAFRPRVSAGNMVSDVEVRVWDPDSASVVVGSAPAKTGTASLSNAPDLGDMAGLFTGLPFSIPSLPHIPGLPDLGIFPSQTARVVVDRPVDQGSGASSAADEMAKGVAEHVASTFAEAEGLTYGNPKVQAGSTVKIAGVPSLFEGTWTVTNARHVFAAEEGGYRTNFVVSGRHDRSLLGLCSIGSTNGERPTIAGLVCGVVTNIDDPNQQGRVKVTLPWLSPSFETDWARVAQAGMGKAMGALFLPSVSDEVLVGFELGDTRRPYVLGGLINGNNAHDLVSGAIAGSGPVARVAQSGIVTATGNRIVFDDDQIPNAPIPNTSSITISDSDGKMMVMIDKKNGTVQIIADSTVPPAKISIEQHGVGGQISVTSQGDISIEAAAPGQLSLKGGAGVSIDAGPGIVEIKGSLIKLN